MHRASHAPLLGALMFALWHTSAPADTNVTATGDTFSVYTDTTTRLGVLYNDPGAPFNVVQLRLATPPRNGSAIVRGPFLEYRPRAGFRGWDRLAYTVKDKGGRFTGADVWIRVVARAVPAPDGHGSVREVAPAPDTARVQVVRQPRFGIAWLDAARRVRYRPVEGFVGVDSMVVRIARPNGETSAVEAIFELEGDALRPDEEGIPPGEEGSDPPRPGEAEDLVLPAEPDPVAPSPPTGVPSGRGDSPPAADSAAPADAPSSPQEDHKPRVRPDSARVDSGETVLVDVMANDSGLGDAPVTLSIEQFPSHGRAQVDKGHIVYRSEPGYRGRDRLIYRVTDRDGDLGMTTVALTVDCPACGTTPRITVRWSPNPASERIDGYTLYVGTAPEGPYTTFGEYRLSSGLIDPRHPRVRIDPVRDLRLGAGDRVCFRVDAFDATERSWPSGHVCARL